MPTDSPPLPPPQNINRLSPMKASTGFQYSGQATSHYYIKQLQMEQSRLRAMIPHVDGPKKAELFGDLAAIESQLHGM